MQDNNVAAGLNEKTTITVTGYVTACDPGCNNISSYHGTQRLSEVKPDQELTGLIEDKWWCSSIRHRFDSLYLIEVREDGVLLRYGKQEKLVLWGRSRKLDEIPLDYAYGELYVSVEREKAE